eukprot:g29996.t2
MVSYIRLLYTKLVVDKRPLVPGDISYVALPFMLTAAHGLTEGARVTGVFAGAVTSGEYSWVGSVLLTLFLNVMVRTGWTRLCGFHLLKWTIGFPYAFICAPTAYSKLHDETKIYVGACSVKTEASRGRREDFHALPFFSAWVLCLPRTIKFGGPLLRPVASWRRSSTSRWAIAALRRGKQRRGLRLPGPKRVAGMDEAAVDLLGLLSHGEEDGSLTVWSATHRAEGTDP